MVEPVDLMLSGCLYDGHKQQSKALISFYITLHPLTALQNYYLHL